MTNCNVVHFETPILDLMKIQLRLFLYILYERIAAFRLTACHVFFSNCFVSCNTNNQIKYISDACVCYDFAVSVMSTRACMY